MTDEHETGEVKKSGRDRMRAAKTLEEVLETAMGFEATARDFYADLAKKVKKPMRELVEELAAEEVEHYNLFANIKDHPDTKGHLKDLIETPSVDHKFSEFVMRPDLGEDPDDQTILQYAISREDMAHQEYAALAETTPPGALKDLFVFLAAEELEHKAELEKTYYELVHSGGV